MHPQPQPHAQVTKFDTKEFAVLDSQCIWGVICTYRARECAGSSSRDPLGGDGGVACGQCPHRVRGSLRGATLTLTFTTPFPPDLPACSTISEPPMLSCFPASCILDALHMLQTSNDEIIITKAVIGTTTATDQLTSTSPQTMQFTLCGS
jgi:hypothetical protein